MDDAGWRVRVRVRVCITLSGTHRLARLRCSSVCKHSLQLVFYEGKRPYSITLQFAQADFQYV